MVTKGIRVPEINADDRMFSIAAMAMSGVDKEGYTLNPEENRFWDSVVRETAAIVAKGGTPYLPSP